MASENEPQSTSFPGFKLFTPKDEYAPLRRALSRLQRRAPRPLALQLRPSVSFKCEGTPKMYGSRDHFSASFSPSSSSSSSSASSSSSSLTSFYQNNKDPIPLLSPLVSPSLVEKSSSYTNMCSESNAA